MLHQFKREQNLAIRPAGNYTCGIMTVTLTLPPELAALLAEKALLSGTTLKAYVESIVERDARGRAAEDLLHGDLPIDEFDRLLDELASGPALPRLPLDFSRADIYADHD
ncbi:MAG TPA: hypothetical protein VF306_14020 [Pirellulales bacterium]